jgi:hypothetical protein
MPKKPPRPKKVPAKKEEVGYDARMEAFIQAREELISDVDFEPVFIITEEEQKRIAVWFKEQDAKVAHMQQESGKYKGDPYVRKLHQRGMGYYGACGGALTFQFSPSGLGTVFKITHALTQETLDLTDYDSM